MKKQLIAVVSALAMTFTSLPCVSIAAENVPKPVLQYTFDGNKQLADQNGKNELKLSGGASVTDDGNKGKGLLLDGTDGYAELPDNILSSDMTVTTWVKINKFTTWGRVFDFGTDLNQNFFFAPYSGGASRLEIKNGATVDTMDCTQETTKDWVNYAITIKGDTVSYYRNGRLIKSKSGIKDISELTNTANYIGKSHYDGDAYLSAVVDDFRVYNTALSQDEILKVMADGEINADVMLDSYAINDEQIVTGDSITLPQADGIVWNETDNLGLINTETGAVKHNKTAETVTLVQSYGGVDREYTLYVTGSEEEPYSINIDASDRSKDVSDDMWGLFFEDINSAADGGLYAEMVQNRSFEKSDEKEGHLYNWGLYSIYKEPNREDGKYYTAENIQVKTDKPMNENNPTYITIPKGEMICNDGFYDGTEWDCDKGTSFSGMKFKNGEKYDFSVYARGEGELTVSLGIVIDEHKASFEVEPFNEAAAVIKCNSKDDWKKYSVTFTADEELESDGSGLIVTNTGDSDLDVDMVSLMPEDTYKGHGLRKDLMEQLEAMHPKFLRFPGGCAVEGQTMDMAWNWKDTIGDVSERKEMINIWNPSATEPCMMTYGLGFYEYFQMCEDLGMEPVPILNCGIACQVRSGSATDEEHLVPMDKLQPYIDDALDLIEFANGTDESNEWVQKRIQMGHKEPFNMKYIGIGNEQYGDIYFERYEEFAKQIHEKYPDINLVTTSGTASSGSSNDLAWNWANEHDELADRMDEHYYETADWFRQHAYRYDNYRRDTNTKVFLGEYASKGNAWYNALSEAAFMTGLERNADVVRMASYAPMFAKYGNTQWSAADMIWFNNSDYVLTPNYYVQSLFSNNQGDYSLPTEVKLNGIEKDDALKGGVAVGSWGTHNEFKDIRLYSGDTIGVLTPSESEEYDDEDDYNLDEEYDEDDYNLEDRGWEIGKGEWTMNKEGALVQSSDETGAICYFPYPDNRQYTLTLKARKLSGGEGFQIGVAVDDALNYYRVNIGGWGNTTAKIQHIVNGVSSSSGNVAEQSYVGNVHINDNEWYDVTVEVTDHEIKAYLNDEFICSYKKPKEYGPVYSSSVYDEETGDVIVKVVNTMDSDVNIGMNVSGETVTSNIAKTTVMSGDTNLENSLDNKNAIVPKESELTNASNNFTYNAPADSFSIIRLKTGNGGSKAYISGYEDGTFRPDNTITRAEVAAIIARCSADFDENKTYSSDFTDVSGDEWYANYVGYAAEKGYIHGYDGGPFKADIDITRGELAVILSKYGSFDGDGICTEFSDVPNDYYATGYIKSLYDENIVSGYEDGTFKPDNSVTRAEAVTMMNKVLDNPIAENAENPFDDVSPNHWAYNQIMTAVQGK